MAVSPARGDGDAGDLKGRHRQYSALPQTYPFLPTVVDGGCCQRCQQRCWLKRISTPFLHRRSQQARVWLDSSTGEKSAGLVDLAPSTSPSRLWSQTSLGPGQLSPSYKLICPWKQNSYGPYCHLGGAALGTPCPHTLCDCPPIHESLNVGSRRVIEIIIGQMKNSKAWAGKGPELVESGA